MMQTKINRHEILANLRQIIPFLQKVPDSIYFNLDPLEFLIPNGDVIQKRNELERKLDHYVMTYRKGVLNRRVALQRHLCANLMTAALSQAKLKILKSFELKLSAAGVAFVVYAKPLTLIEPHQSALYRHLPFQRRYST